MLSPLPPTLAAGEKASYHRLVEILCENQRGPPGEGFPRRLEADALPDNIGAAQPPAALLSGLEGWAVMVYGCTPDPHSTATNIGYLQATITN